MKQGEVAVINIRNCPEWLYMAFGFILAGVRFVGLSRGGTNVVTTMEILKTCSLLAVDPGANLENWESLKGLVDFCDDKGHVSSKRLPTLRYLVGHAFSNVEDAPSLLTVDDLISSSNPNVELPMVDECDTAVMFMTSGSTGVPKMASHTHASLMAVRNLRAVNIPESIRLQFRIFNDRPFSWMGGFPLTLLIGFPRITISGFGESATDKLGHVIDVITQEKATSAFFIPPFVFSLIEMQDRLPADWPLKIITIGGQRLVKGFSKALGKVCDVIQVVYVSTETCVISDAMVTDPDKLENNFSGFALCGVEVKVVDEDGATVPVNTRGTFCVRSFCMFKDYFNDPVKSAEAFTGDGWFRTGDIGRISERGEVCVDGRKENMIISGGLTVLPEVLENVIETHPGVESAMIVSIPETTNCEVLCACVQREKGSDITEDDIRMHCQKVHHDNPHLFSVLPKFYMIVDTLPLLPIGKNDRKTAECNARQRFAV